MVGESGSAASSGDDSGTSSPKNKVKFLCSYGGKVLSRPSDGLLKYVGGETRVVSVPRHTTFSELMKKLSAMVDGDMVLKYQLVPEDLDALVTVRTDEDLKHMIDEHDRHESGGAPMLRGFLFPSKPFLLENQAAVVFEPYMLEQRYIDAINGIIRTSPRAKCSPIRTFSTSSACSSPQSNSPDGHTTDLGHELPFNGCHSSRVMMHRVRSSPSISSLSNLQSHSNGFGSSFNIQQYDHSRHPNQSQHQHHHPLGYPLSRPAQDLQIGIGMGRPPQIMPLGKADISRDNGFNYYYSTSRPQKACAYQYHDDFAAYGHVRSERAGTVPRSPRKSIWE